MSEPSPIDMAFDHQRPGQDGLEMGDTKPSVVEILGAFICAEAVYSLDVEPSIKSIRALLPSFSIRFEKVHVSKEIFAGLVSKLLVAYTSEAVFIAFLGSAEDPDASLKHNSEYGNAVLGSEQRLIVGQLLRSRRRIILSGLAVGGTLAHLVMLSILKDETILDGDIRAGPAMFSISFGATCDPPDSACDSYSHHFLSFVDARHPESALSQSDHDRSGRSIRNSIGRIVRLQGWDLAQGYVGNCLSSLLDWTEFGNDSTGQSSSIQTPAASTPPPGYVGNCLSSLLDWTVTEFQPLEFGNDSTGQSSSIQIPAASTPAPVVNSAQWKTLDTGARYIEIHGKNLLFLRCSVMLNGIEPFQTKRLEDNFLLIMDGRDNVHEIGSMDCVIIQTAFGSANQLVTQNIQEEAEVCRLLSQVIETLIALSRPPMPIRTCDDVLLRLDRIVQSAPGSEDKMLSTELKNILGRAYLVEHLQNVKKLIDPVKSFLNNGFEVKYNRSLDQSAALRCLEIVGISLQVAGAVAIVASTAGLFALAVQSAIAGALLDGSLIVCNFGGGLTLMAAVLDQKTVSFTYAGFLALAISEVDTISDSEPRDPQTQSSPETSQSLAADSSRKLERKLLEKVRQSHRYEFLLSLKDQSGLWDRLDLKSKVLKGITVDTRKRLLQKMRIVANTIHLFESEVEGKRFVGIQGAEDVGKSTFIKKALERCGQTVDLPEAGHRQHTQEMKPYNLNEDTWLVDFPGSNGSSTFADEWKMFTALPSDCVLFLLFKDDIKKDQCEMYEKMKKELQTQITVVFNKVDIKLTQKTKDYYTKQKFSDLRDLAAKQLRCKHEDVYFAALEPKRGTNVSMLKERGVLDFDDLAQKLRLP